MISLSRVNLQLLLILFFYLRATFSKIEAYFLLMGYKRASFSEFMYCNVHSDLCLAFKEN